MRRLDRNDSLDDLQDQMRKMFNQLQNYGRERLNAEVPINMKEEDGNIVVTADLPGVEKENINLKADDNRLEISAESSTEIKEENEKYIRRERSSRHFRRTVSWPVRVDTESINAEYEDGVLRVEAEKEDETGGRDINIE